MNLEKCLWREETTDWDTPNHIYITKGTELVGFVPRGGELKIFTSTFKSWSPSRRKLGIKEIRNYLQNNA